MIPNGMNIPSTSAAAAVSQSAETGDARRTQLQAMLLRKVLDAQVQQGAELARQLEGKGQILDIRA